MLNLPIIRVEVDHMRQAVYAAFTDYQMKMDEYVRKSIDEYCKPENIERVIEKATFEALNAAINEEVQNFFWKGDGRQIVAAAVKEKLLSKETYTPLDGV